MADEKQKNRKDEKSSPPQIKVTVEYPDKHRKVHKFDRAFRVGRDESCDIRIESPGVSRNHAEIYFKGGYWWYKDLNSANGSFVLGRRVEEIPLGKATKVELGLNDAQLTFSVPGFHPEGKTVQEKAPSVTQLVQHYFADEPEKQMGDHTRMIHNAFKTVQKKQRYKYFAILSVVVIIAIGIGIYSYRQHRQMQRQKLLAEQIFYSMKSLELELSHLQAQAEQENDSTALQKIKQQRKQQRKLLNDYDHFLQEIHFYENSQWNEKDRIILHVARLFGECELGMPEEFLDEVYSYIKKWRTTPRLKNAIQSAVKNGYNEIVSKTMLEHNLPPQFFYLGLQESSFNIRTVGPKTRFGIAKGVWQFIPATARRYGLKTGPLVGLRRFDPRDERSDFVKSTRAAARYIRDIYNTEAQASGLLVIASYNWGERNIRTLVRKMPANPRQRNFWQLLKKYRNKIPKETYNYVFYIISAAVIGENPRLFGFDFDNPLNPSAPTASR